MGTPARNALSAASAAGRVNTKPIPRRGLQAGEGLPQGLRHHHDLLGLSRQGTQTHRLCVATGCHAMFTQPGALATTAKPTSMPRCRQARTGDRPPARPHLACGRPPVLAETTQALHQRVVTRGDQLGAAQARGTLKERIGHSNKKRGQRNGAANGFAALASASLDGTERCDGVPAWRRARATRSDEPPWGSPCEPRTDTEDTPRAVACTGGRGVPWPRMEAAEIACTLASPLTMACAGTFNTGMRLPSTSTMAGLRRSPPPRAAWPASWPAEI